MTFTLTWLLFAVLWWIIGVTHGDFAEDRSEDHKPCMDNVHDFPTAFLFSLETQHTIGYGGRAVTSECPGAVIMMMIQSITGVLVQALMTGRDNDVICWSRVVIESCPYSATSHS